MKKLSNQFTGKALLFTGKMHLIKEIGRQKVMYRLLCDAADIQFKSTVSKKLNFVIIGSEPGPSKLEKVEELNSQGSNIEIIDEEEFIKRYFELTELPDYIDFYY